jgi:chemotaxis protein methyltransferase WspC
MRLASDERVAEVEAALRRRVGLDAASLGAESLRRALRQRMASCAMDEGGHYVLRLLADEAEFTEFVEELLVPETWFFRDVRPFWCLRRFVAENWRPDAAGKRLRLLSVPCSTGEEPYSMAMTLLDLGLLPGQFQVDGVDLSRRVLAQAAQGRYRDSSLRGDEREFPGLCERFLEQRGNRYVVNDPVRASVRFRQANLVADGFLAGELPYDVIFCRNVLIYLHAEARSKALSRLHRLLVPSGLLYVGHVEARVVAEGPFRGSDHEYPFAFCPGPHGSSGTGSDAGHSGDRPAWDAAGASPAASGKVKIGPPGTRRPAPLRSRAESSRHDTAVSPASQTGRPEQRGRQPAPVPARRPTSAGIADLVPDAELINAAREAADSGRLDEAAALCQKTLEKCPTSADAFCLLGLIQRARGAQAEAEKHFQKALYLAPQHHEALVHMMLLAEQRGDRKTAANLRRRAEQATGRGG